MALREVSLSSFPQQGFEPGAISMRDRAWIMEALPRGERERAHVSQGGCLPHAPAACPAEQRLLAALARGRPPAPTRCGGGRHVSRRHGSWRSCWWWWWYSGGVLHFVGSCCGELGTNSNHREAQRGVHLRRLCPAPRGKKSRVPPAVPRGGEECSARRRRPGAGSQALRPPSAKMEDAHFPCAVLPPALAMALTPALSRTWGAQPTVLRPGPSLPHLLILRCPEEGERERAQIPALPLLTGINSCQPRGAFSPGESLLHAPGSNRWRHFQPGAGSLPRDQPGEPAEQPCCRVAQKSLKGWLLPPPPLMCLVNNSHVWERPEIYLPLSQQYI